MKPIEDLKEVCIDLTNKMKTIKIEKELDGQTKEELIQFLVSSKDVFARTHSNIIRIDPTIISRALNIDSNVTLVQQKKRQFNKV